MSVWPVFLSTQRYQSVREVEGRRYETAKHWNPTHLCSFLAIMPITVPRELSLHRARWEQGGSLHRAVNVVRKSCLHWTGWECNDGVLCTTYIPGHATVFRARSKGVAYSQVQRLPLAIQDPG
jgi:hypothetical protein